MNIAELKDKTVSDLQRIARELGLSGYSGLRKDDLIYRIIDAAADSKSTAKAAPRREAPAQPDPKPAPKPAPVEKVASSSDPVEKEESRRQAPVARSDQQKSDYGDRQGGRR